MTTISKPVTRRVDLDAGRVPVAVTIYPHGVIGFREKGARKEYFLTIMSAYRLAVEMDRKRK
jgi:hypothetical protein